VVGRVIEVTLVVSNFGHNEGHDSGEWSVEVVRMAEDRSQGEWFIHHYDSNGEPVWRRVSADAGESSMTGSSFSD
jgi:hypothetical protein